MNSGPDDSSDWSSPQFSILSILVLTFILAPCFLAYRYGGLAGSRRMAVIVGAFWILICFV